MARSATDAIFKKLTRGAHFAREEVSRERKRFQVPSSQREHAGNATSSHLPTSAVAAQLDYFGMHQATGKQKSREEEELHSEEHEDSARMQSVGGRFVRAHHPAEEEEEEDVFYDSFSEGDDSVEEEEEESEEESDGEDQVMVFASSAVRPHKKNAGKRTSSQLSHRQVIKRLRAQHRIKVQGSEVPDPLTSFDNLCNDTYHVDRRLVDNIRACHYVFPTSIQRQAIPILLQVLACSCV
jgi:hypothetical protein